MSMDRFRRRIRPLDELESLGVKAVVGAGVGLVLSLIFGWPPVGHVLLGLAVAFWKKSWEWFKREWRALVSYDDDDFL